MVVSVWQRVLPEWSGRPPLSGAVSPPIIDYGLFVLIAVRGWSMGVGTGWFLKFLLRQVESEITNLVCRGPVWRLRTRSRFNLALFFKIQTWIVSVPPLIDITDHCPAAVFAISSPASRFHSSSISLQCSVQWRWAL